MIALGDYKNPMARKQTAVSLDRCQALVESYAVNERMNQMVLERLDPAAWRAKLPGRGARTIAAIFSHVHDIRRKWLRLSGPASQAPQPLDRSRCSQMLASVTLAESAARCCEMLAEALAQLRLAQPPGRVETFYRDGWAKPWPAGAAKVAYMISHDAHHRGQVCMLAHQLGFPLTGKGAYGIWAWEKLWSECGFTHSR